MTTLRKCFLSCVILTVLFNTYQALSIDNEDQYNINNINLITRNKRSDDASSTENTTDYRLPQDVVPREYFIHLTPFIIPDNFTFTGKVEIIIEVKKTTSKIVLHADVEDIHETTVSVLGKNNQPTSALDLLNVTKTETYQFLNILLKSPIRAKTRVILTISYTGTIFTDNSVGLFASAYKEGNETKWLLGTHLEPAQARNVFPCFDEPSFKAVFHLKVTVPRNYAAISNMPVKCKNNGVFEFEKTPPMSTYIIALVVSEFKNVALEDDDELSIKIWSNPELIDQTTYALSVASKAIDFFESHFEISYTLPKLDLVAMPDFVAGAMENWGLPLYRESFILFDPAVTPISRKRFIQTAVTHELTHQWFGNLVTPKLWNYLWVSEAFAAYFEYHAHDKSLASWKLDSQFVVNEMQPSFAVDGLLSSEPMTREVYSYLEILLIFDTIVYTKGASVVRMVEKLIGPELFYGALHRYLQNNKYKTGTPESVYAAIEKELKVNDYKLKIPVDEFLNSWTLQAGFPVVNVNLSGNTATLSQQRFLLKNPDNLVDNTTWVIPISWATRSKPNFGNTRKVTWLTEKEKNVTIKNAEEGWVIFNVQQTGYYRVNYDRNSWTRIINALKSKDYKLILEINRASIIDDLFNLARVGAVDYDTLLAASEYLSQETSYIPWKAAFEGLHYLKNRFTGHPEVFERFRAHVLSLLEPSYRRLGFYDKKREKPIDQHLRESVLEWLCSLEHPDCIKQSVDEFDKLLKNKSYQVPANQQPVVYCTAIRHGSNDHWNYLLQKLNETNNGIEKLTILSALACSRNSTNIESLLLNSVTPNQGIRLHDVENLFEFVVKFSPVAVESMLNFLQNHFLKVQEYTGDDGAAINAFDNLAQHLPTKQLVEKFDAYIKKNKENMSSISEELESALKDATYELNWYNENVQKVDKWLSEHVPKN